LPGILSVLLFLLFYFIPSRQDYPKDILIDFKYIELIGVIFIGTTTIIFALLYFFYSFNKTLKIDTQKKEYHYKDKKRNIIFKDGDVLLCRHIKNDFYPPNLTIYYEFLIIDLKNNERITLTSLLGDFKDITEKLNFSVTLVKERFIILNQL
jgi:hypothetical protein